jgi:4-hydroxy-2-oxoheptanedioate aldolase
MKLKQRLSDTQDRLANFIVTVPSAVVTQALAAAGADSLIIDIEHGAVDYGSAHAMIAATHGYNCAALVRIAENTDAQVKRALDIGAQGIVFPLIETAEQASWAVSSLRYPPHGRRTFGPFIAHSFEGVPLAEYADHIDDTLTCCLLVETVKGVENIEQICAVPGIDIIVPAAFDPWAYLGNSRHLRSLRHWQPSKRRRRLRGYPWAAMHFPPNRRMSYSQRAIVCWAGLMC